MWNTWSKWHEKIDLNQFRLIYCEKKKKRYEIVSHFVRQNWKKWATAFGVQRNKIEFIFRSWCFSFYPTHNTVSTSTLNVIWKMFRFLFSTFFQYFQFSFFFSNLLVCQTADFFWSFLCDNTKDVFHFSCHTGDAEMKMVDDAVQKTDDNKEKEQITDDKLYFKLI